MYVIYDNSTKCYLTDLYKDGSTRWGSGAKQFENFGAAFKTLFVLGLGWGWRAEGLGGLKLDFGVMQFEIIKVEKND